MSGVPLVSAADHNGAASAHCHLIQIPGKGRAARMIPIIGSEPQTEDNRSAEGSREAVRVLHREHDVSLFKGGHCVRNQIELPEVRFALLEFHDNNPCIRRGPQKCIAFLQSAACRDGGNIAAMPVRICTRNDF